MTAFHVKNGTNAGWRTVKPIGKPWRCRCGIEHRAYAKNCSVCFERQS